MIADECHLYTSESAQYFNKLGIKAYRYDSSYVHSVYATDQNLDWNNIRTDLESIITKYKTIVLTKQYYVTLERIA